MAANVEQSPFFQQQISKGEVVVKDPPKFDLESYIANYAGFTRIDRLSHIGSHSPYLAVDAYRLAIAEAKKGKNVNVYTSLVENFSSIAPQDPAALTDTTWAEKKTRETQQEQDRLEHELKSYKNNLIKESIRMGNEDLGHFYYDTGDYSNAQKAYLKMREHCTSNKHLADMTLRLVYVSIAQKSWLGVQANLAKVDAAQLKGEEKTKLEPIVSACTGLSHMAMGNYREAAANFLGTSPAFLIAEPAANITWQKEVLSGNDVAVYGGLCALASMDRSDLQNRVLGNSEFRNFLELEPHIRRAIALFCNSKYSACLEILESYRNDYLLDVYLSKVLNTIYGRIRTKSIVQYFIPFSCVTLDEMASKFPAAGHRSIEDELEEMINNETLDARIDLVDRLLISPPTNPRHDVHAEALAMAETYDHTLRLRLTRINMLAAGMDIQQSKGFSGEKTSSGLGDGIGASLRGLGSKMGFT
ncbi:PCI-domain-containing protein [Cucurbitaria berberidis CBS 394.84]|uniref:COP9 signalosome complex subunit 1 n=1 Tax=Cucurbitaria berberidis CBS 394.84 TaxID=1168544 RepID=A0A9P4GBM4_9PLEO|nr:PCI-domain-containing protein [Cucurbitaria berberidis CBS 394.84]KAF1842260.1 PCI-domain-containing protein [Cucurbitaria berberidis CBS 394.84]